MDGPWQNYAAPQTPVQHGPWENYSPQSDGQYPTAQQTTDASSALVHSNLLNVSPSYAYEHRDTIKSLLGDRLGEYVEAGDYGFRKESIIGEMWRKQVPEPFESSDEVSHFLEGFGQMIADLPVYVLGGVAGGLAGGTAGSFEVPIIGTVSGGAIGGGAGAFALPAGMRQWLIDKYRKQKISSFDEAMDILKATGKGAAIGAVMSFFSEAVGVSKLFGPRPYTLTASRVATTTKAAVELAAMTATANLLEGKVPSARDFAQNAALVALLHVSMGGLEFARKALPDIHTKTMGLYSRDGVHPADVSSTAAQHSIGESPVDNPMEILNKIDNEIAGITGQSQEAVEATQSPSREESEVQPKLRPAIRQGDTVQVGHSGDTHQDIVDREATDGEHGFVTPEDEFLTREQAAKWVEKNEPEIARNLSGEPLHSEPYNAATGIKNAVTESEREMRGLPEVEVEARRSFGTAFEAGKKAVDSGRIDARDLAQKLANSPRPLNAEESAALVYDRMKLQNEHSQVMQAIDEDRSKGDEAKEVADRDRLQKIEDALNTNDYAARRTGYEQGLGLAARKLMIAQDYSLANVLQRARAASPDGTIAPDVRNRLEDLTRQVDEANKRIDAYEESKKQAAAENTVERIKRTARTEKRQATKTDLKTEYDSLIKDLNTELMHLSANPMLNPKLYELFGKLAVNRIHSGLVTIEQIVDDLHGALQDRGISKREIRDYISGYGRKIELSKEDIQVKLREARAQGRLVSSLEDAQKKKAPLHTGLQRGEPSARVRELQKQVNHAMREAGIGRYEEKPSKAKPADEGKIKSLETQIADLDRRIKEGDTSSRATKREGPESERVTKLTEQRDKLREQYQEMKDSLKQRRSASDIQAASLRTNIEELDRRIKEGDIAAQSSRREGPDTEEVANLRTQRDQLRDRLSELQKQSKENTAKSAEQKQLDSLKKQISDLEERIKEGDTSRKTARREGPSTEAVAKLREKRDALSQTLAEMRQGPKKTEDEKNLARYKTMVEKKIKMFEQQLASGNFAKPTRRQTVLDQQAENLKEQAEKLKSQVDDAIHKQKLAARNPAEKGAALFQKWRRAVLLSSVNTLGKLTTAAMLRFGTTPIEELVGGVLSYFPVLSDIAAKAPREGGGLNLSAEAKAFGQFFEKATAADIKEAVRTGKTSLDYLYGKKSTLPPEALDFFGHLHGALKVLPKRAEFFRSLEKRAQWAIDNHLDIQDPKVQGTLAADAYIDANRAIFMQENFINTGFRMLVNYFHSQGLSGRATEFMIQTVLPIVKVPTNIVAETFDYATGSVTGSLKALSTVIKKDGLKNLTGHEADNIMRSLKKGSVGLAALAIGYYAGGSSGFLQATGFYQPGDEKKQQKPETISIGGVELPPWLQHTPIGLVFEMGATMRRVNDAYTMRGKSGGFVAGAMSAGLGTLRKVPFLEEATRLGEATRTADSAGLFMDDLIQSLVIPPDLRRIAEMTDQGGQKRKPTDLKETVEQNIPGLREDVPTKQTKKRFSIR